MKTKLLQRMSIIIAALVLAIGGGIGVFHSWFSEPSNAADTALINPETGLEYPDHIINGDFEYYKDTIFSFGDQWVPFPYFPKYINRDTGAIRIATYRSQSGEHFLGGYDSTEIGWCANTGKEIGHWQDTSSKNAFGLIVKDGELFQDIKTVPGTKYVWKIRHSSSSPSALSPSIQVLIGTPSNLVPSPATRITSNGNDAIGFVGNTITTNVTGKTICIDRTQTINGVDYCTEFVREIEGSWETYTGEYTVPEGQNITRFTFRNTDQQGLPSTSGVNIIDDVVFSVLCPISFVDPLDKDKVLKQEDVPAYTAAAAPDVIPEHEGYTFKGYVDENGEAVDLSSISKPGKIYLDYELDPLTIEVVSNTDGHGAATVSWPSYDYRNKNFKVYQSSDGGGTWNSVGIDYTSVTNVKCLQIYPHDSARSQLKTWMETNGYGRGIIKIDSVHIDDFNIAPDYYLKDSNDNYQYDVIFFGTWDGNNNGIVTKDLSEISAEKTKAFIKTGRGVIFGHDTLTENEGDTTRNFVTLMSDCAIYMPEPCVKPDGSYSSIGMIYSGCSNAPWQGPAVTELSKVKITKKGLLTNYPWEIGDVGDVLTVPACHNRQATTGTIWMRFTDNAYSEADMSSEANFYLSTNDNTAMIQTGHANGQATPDEQKILANLIFYMNQLLFDSGSLRDASAQDVAAPAIHGYRIDSDSSGAVSFDSEDFGTTYSYYAESYSKDDTTETGKLATSNIADTTVTTGISKYYYIFDDNADTEIIDIHATGIAEANTGNISYVGNEGNYMHVVAVDGAGNMSTTYTLRTPSPADAVFEVSKEMKDGTSIADGEFSFQLYKTNVNDYTTSGSATVIDTAECNASGKAILSASGENAIKYPGTYAYSIREVNDGRAGIVFDPHLEAVHVQASDNGDGTLRLEYSYDMSDESDSTKGIFFQNTRAPAPLVVEKTSSGVSKKYENREYEFVLELRDSQGIPVSDVTYHRTSENNDMGKKEEIENGLISSGDVFRLRAGEEMMLETTDGTSYKVEEHLLPGYAVEALNNTGTLEHDFDGDTMFQTVTFHNVYSALGTPSGIGGIVTNKDAKIEEEQYAFKLISPDGDDISASRNESDGSFKFELPTFDAQDADKTFTYVIRQQVPDEPGGYIYDEEEELVYITVRDNGDGTLSFDVVYEKGGKQSSSPIPFENSYSIKMPETGMSGARIGMVLGGLLVIIALCGMGTTFKCKRRKSIDNR